MIDRYTLPEMQEVWAETSKLLNMVHVERSVVEALGQHGIIDKEDDERVSDAINCDRECRQNI